MNPFESLRSLAIDGSTPHSLGAALLRMAAAALLGAAVAYRPWRRLLPRLQPMRLETAQAQTLIAMAAALMVEVIGDSIARAFGLVGLGAFIRFRSGIKDPRDAAVLFVMIGVGMSCGLGSFPLAATATLFAALVLFLFDVRGRVKKPPLRVAIVVMDPLNAAATLRDVFPDSRLLSLPCANPEPGKLVVEIQTEERLDAAQLLSRLEQHGMSGIRQVTLEDDDA